MLYYNMLSLNMFLIIIVARYIMHDKLRAFTPYGHSEDITKKKEKKRRKEYTY